MEIKSTIRIKIENEAEKSRTRWNCEIKTKKIGRRIMKKMVSSKERKILYEKVAVLVKIEVLVVDSMSVFHENKKRGTIINS